MKREEQSLEQMLGLGDFELPALRAARELADLERENEEHEARHRRARARKWMAAALVGVGLVGLVLYWALPVGVS